MSKASSAASASASSSSGGTLSSRVITARQNRAYDRVYSALGFFGIYFIVTAFAAPIFSGSGIPSLYFFAGILALMLLGWWLQAGFCAATHNRREQSTRSYEQENKFYQPKLALPIAVVAAVGGVIGAKLCDRYLWQQSMMHVGAYYDQDSVIPLAVGLLVFAVVMIGSFVWFFPYDRLLTGRGTVIGAVLISSAFMLFSVSGGSALSIVAICLIGYVLCAVIATNQYAITRSYHGTVVSFLTPRARNYNLMLVGALVLGFAVICCVCYVAFIGVKTLVLIAVAAALSSGDDSEMGRLSRQDPEYQQNVNEYIFGSSRPNETLNYWLFILFFILLAVGLTVVIARNTNTVRRLITLIKDWILSLFELIFRPILDFASPGDGEDVFCNYVDEEERLQDAEIREYREAAAPKRMSYRDFLGELHARHTPEEKYRFAYTFFTAQLRNASMFVRTSDTPREIAERVRVSRRFEDAADTDEKITAITEEYEKIEYAGDPANSDHAALDDLCSLIKQNL